MDDTFATPQSGLETLAAVSPAMRFQPQRRNIHPKLSTQHKKSSSEQVCLNNFGWVPDSCHREEGKSSCELFGQVRVNAPFFWYFGILGGFWASSVWLASSQIASDVVERCEPLRSGHCFTAGRCTSWCLATTQGSPYASSPLRGK